MRGPETSKSWESHREQPDGERRGKEIDRIHSESSLLNVKYRSHHRKSVTDETYDMEQLGRNGFTRNSERVYD